MTSLTEEEQTMHGRSHAWPAVTVALLATAAVLFTARVWPVGAHAAGSHTRPNPGEAARAEAWHVVDLLEPLVAATGCVRGCPTIDEQVARLDAAHLRCLKLIELDGASELPAEVRWSCAAVTAAADAVGSARGRGVEEGRRRALGLGVEAARGLERALSETRP